MTLPSGSLSVVVITKDRRTGFLRTLDHLEWLPESPPVVVVANGCSDGTEPVVREHHPGVQVVSLPANVGAVGRNIGVRVAATPYVAYCDDDMWWEAGSLTRAWTAVRTDRPARRRRCYTSVGPRGS